MGTKYSYWVSKSLNINESHHFLVPSSDFIVSNAV